MNPDVGTPRLAAESVWIDSGLLIVIVNALGDPTHPERYSERFRRIAAEAEPPPIRPHALRHSLPLILREWGVKPVDAASLLGYRVDVYLSTHLPESDSAGLEHAADVLGNGFAEVG